MRAHAFNAFLALVFSILIWCAVGAQLTEQDAITIDFRIGVPRGFIVSYRKKPSTDTSLLLEDEVTVEVRGPKEQILRLNQLGLKGVFNLTKQDAEELVRKGEALTLQPYKYVGAPKPLEVVSAEPSELVLTVQRVEDRLVWVQPGELQGTAADGFRAGQVTINPRRVAVRGAATVLEANPGPYRTEAIDLDRANENFEIDRSVICPDGVVAQRRVLVSVEIVPDLVTKAVEFPVSVLQIPRGTEPIRPLPCRVEAREGWYRKLKLRGPPELLEALEDRLDAARVGRTFDPTLPKAYVLASDLKPQLTPGQTEQFDSALVEITGLPAGVEYIEKDDFPVRLVPLE